jgi:mono/diheme cytochrome c family protein
MARSLALLFAVLALAAIAGCGGGETVSPAPETVEGTIAEEEAPDFAQGDPEAGRVVFTETASPTCGSCHTYEAAETSAEIGPNLDEALADNTPEEIYEQIVNPDSEVTEGFSEGVMPDNYGETLDEQQLVDLVAFLTPAR